MTDDSCMAKVTNNHEVMFDVNTIGIYRYRDDGKVNG